MTDPRTEQIGSEAARLIQAGRTDDLNRAIHMAADALKLYGAPLPGRGRVRKHAQAMSMQALGETGYRERRREVWRIAEEIMTAFELALPEATTLLVGRAALGQIDAGVTIHIRIYADEPSQCIASILDEFGYEALLHSTADARVGRLNQIAFEEDGIKVVITRCLLSMWADRDRDVFTDKPVETAGLSELRQTLAFDEPQE